MNYLIGTRTNLLVAQDEAAGVEGRNKSVIGVGLSVGLPLLQEKGKGETGLIGMTRTGSSLERVTRACTQGGIVIRS